MGSRAPASRRFAVALVWLASCHAPAVAPAPARCDADAGARPAVTFGQRAYDVAFTATSPYVVALERRIAAFDPCTLAELTHCDDPEGARRILRVDGARRVTYVRGGGGVAHCDLQRGGAITRDDAPAPAPSSRVQVGEVTLDLAGGVATLRPPGVPARVLPMTDEPLAVALDAGAHLAAVADRAGTISFFTVPHGLLLDRVRAHDRNAYALRFDAARARVVSVSGAGQLDVRPIPPRPIAWVRTQSAGSPP